MEAWTLSSPGVRPNTYGVNLTMTQHSLEEKSLPELKQIALEFGLSQEQVAEHGDRRRRSVWIKAIKAAQGAGKVTQVYQNLPIVKTLAQLAKEDEHPEPELWCDDMYFLGALEDFFFQQRRAGWVVQTDLLESRHLEDERFNYWADWIIPGNLFTTYRQSRTYQVLMIDKTSKAYYMPVDKPQLMATYLLAVRKFAYPTPLPESGGIVEAANYIRILHEATEEPAYRTGRFGSDGETSKQEVR